jgi:hypothetical protein
MTTLVACGSWDEARLVLGRVIDDAIVAWPGVFLAGLRFDRVVYLPEAMRVDMRSERGRITETWLGSQVYGRILPEAEIVRCTDDRVPAWLLAEAVPA